MTEVVPKVQLVHYCLMAMDRKALAIPMALRACWRGEAPALLPDEPFTVMREEWQRRREATGETSAIDGTEGTTSDPAGEGIRLCGLR